MTRLSVLHNPVTNSMAEPAITGGGHGRGGARRVHYAPGSH
jgi:hypothetical protein